MGWHVQCYEDPWPYVLIDNFFDESQLRTVQREVEQIENSVEPATDEKYGHPADFSMRFDDNGAWKGYTPTHHFSRLGFQFPDIFESTASTLNQAWMQDYFGDYRKFHQLVSNYSVQISSEHYEYRIHNDAPRKVLSGIVYVLGNGPGTSLYTRDKEFSHTITWKINRALIFAPIDDLTWHSYCAGDEPRVTLNYNLIRIGNRPD